MDASKLPSQTLPVKNTWSGVMMEDNALFWSILAALPVSIASIALIVNSRESIVLLVTAHSDSFPIPSDTQHLIWRKSGLCDRLKCLTSLRLQSFSNIIVVCCPLFIARYQSFQKWLIFCFVSAIHKLKFGLLNVLNHVASKHRAFLCIQPYAYPTILWSMFNSLAAHTIFFNFLEDLEDRHFSQ